MRVVLFLILWMQGHPEPMMDQAQVTDIKTCYEQLGKLLNQPLPPQMEKMQAGCFIMKEPPKG